MDAAGGRPGRRHGEVWEVDRPAHRRRYGQAPEPLAGPDRGQAQHPQAVRGRGQGIEQGNGRVLAGRRAADRRRAAAGPSQQDPEHGEPDSDGAKTGLRQGGAMGHRVGQPGAGDQSLPRTEARSLRHRRGIPSHPRQGGAGGAHRHGSVLPDRPAHRRHPGDQAGGRGRGGDRLRPGKDRQAPGDRHDAGIGGGGGGGQDPTQRRQLLPGQQAQRQGVRVYGDARRLPARPGGDRAADSPRNPARPARQEHHGREKAGPGPAKGGRAR